MKISENLREDLANLEHQQWESWTRYIVENTEKLPSELKRKWKPNWIPYEELTEELKDKDRVWSDKVLGIFRDHAIKEIRGLRSNKNEENEIIVNYLKNKYKITEIEILG